MDIHLSLEKEQHLKKILSDMESIIIAFSGGVDSTYLLKVALDTLGKENVLAITADSESFPRSELEETIRIAKALNAPHQVIQMSELSIPGYAENDLNRCYYCKKGLFDELYPIMIEQGYKNLTFGLIKDDLGEHRPGVKAAMERNVRGPLAEADITKEDIRIRSKELGLDNWDKPSLACLSSRIAYGEKITIEKLKKVDQAEQFIKSFGIKQVRVRVHNEIARIEVEPQDMANLLTYHEQVSVELKQLGFKYVAMDLTGYKSGSMNQMLQSSAAK
ncbi:ATP-dependent sacrificial sulfur transferase LarE [Bacillus sp. ISL-47]|uniref:ATP-dependent sacrificial sulfur transferase LarE n=1 Tax=Bacillus sp. ISL-47 TaxID=2819130 RepID=UPI001BE98A9C|nr:ATP-dependent sacrificial sulfur transferase LarE [Bacillus sp. ISL-47]MBT2689128.1 ATP-dependent sacrificial sulfur transferase LarE [Bacillus sp. ISL-47]MBT2708584.1 ATP-dependent sacrificial sulfur transferase LarE [Pseudomonas sp. ISL-84]